MLLYTWEEDDSRITVNVEIFVQYIFSRILRMVSDARKYDVSKNINHFRLKGIRYKMRENISAQKCHLMRENLAARKYVRSQYMVL